MAEQRGHQDDKFRGNLKVLSPGPGNRF